MTKEPLKDQIVRDTSVTNRVFSYTRNACTLKFTLRTDIKQELKDYAELLKVGLADVEAQLESMKK